ncbi:20846_t:CDS:2, partial [Gigaspora rosea]
MNDFHSSSPLPCFDTYKYDQTLSTSHFNTYNYDQEDISSFYLSIHGQTNIGDDSSSSYSNACKQDFVNTLLLPYFRDYDLIQQLSTNNNMIESDADADAEP